MSDLLERLQTVLGDRYAIEREIGRGGMALVYLADDLKHRRKVAIKVLQPELARAIGPERFLQEIEIAAQLTHPNILPLHDSGQADGLLYYVMPYVEGESLRGRMDREEQLPLEDAIAIVGDVAGALSYAHQQGVIHRDIKPENILMAAGRPVVSDFGIARAVDAAGSKRLTETGLAVGSPGYMSPEQAAGDTTLDERTDIYSLGCVAYELLAGAPPFAGATPQVILAKVLTDPPPSVRKLQPTVSEGVEREIQRALAKAPGDRFDTAAEFAEALAEANTAQAIAQDAQRLRRTRRRRFAAGVAAVVLLVVAGWWLTTSLGGPRFERLAVLPPTNLMNDPEQEFLLHGVHNALISELQQAGIAVIARTSVMQYADTDTPIREIAAELGVDALVESSVLRAGDSVDVEVRLVDGDTQEYVGDPIVQRADLGNVLALYRDLTRAIASEIQAVLTPVAEARLAEARAVNPEAYEAYLKGVFHAQRWNPEDWTTALEYLDTVLEIDPDYAPAYVEIGAVWGMRAQAGLVSPDEARAQRGPALERALALDSTLASAHGAIAASKTWLDWDWAGGEAAFRRAIELNPGDAQDRILYGHLLSILGRWEEAAEQVETGLELDPLNPFVQGLYAAQLFMARRYEDAVESFQEMFRRNPGAGFGRTPLADALRQMGREEEAFQVERESYELFGDHEMVATLDRGYRLGGYRGAYRLAADTLVVRADAEDGSAKHFDLVRFYILAGEIEKALEWLEEAFEARNPNTPYISVIPTFEVLHDHPRFRDLARRMNLPILTGPDESG